MMIELDQDKFFIVLESAPNGGNEFSKSLYGTLAESCANKLKAPEPLR